MIKLIFVSTFLFLLLSKAWAGEELYTNTLPAILCEPNQYFSSCFEISQKKCSQNMGAYGEQCLALNQKFIQEIQNKKDPLVKKQTAVRIKIGTCMGELYEKNHHAVKKDSKKCFSEKNWTF